MKSATYTITNKMGIHARPAADIAKLVGKHKSDVTIATATKKANGKSVLMLTTLGAKNGTEVPLSHLIPGHSAYTEGKKKSLHSLMTCSKTIFMRTRGGADA